MWLVDNDLLEDGAVDLCDGDLLLGDKSRHFDNSVTLLRKP